MIMTGRIALKADKLFSAIDKALRSDGHKIVTPEWFLTALHEQGYDVVRIDSDLREASSDLEHG